jgi:diadenosine tetraphosphate (Ap4A) HIT family hydrolase
MATGELLIKAKTLWDERLARDGYFLCWTSWPATVANAPNMHAHLHVVPRFDDEPRAHQGWPGGYQGSREYPPRATPPRQRSCALVRSEVAIEP